MEVCCPLTGATSPKTNVLAMRLTPDNRPTTETATGCSGLLDDGSSLLFLACLEVRFRPLRGCNKTYRTTSLDGGATAKNGLISSTLGKVVGDGSAGTGVSSVVANGIFRKDASLTFG